MKRSMIAACLMLAASWPAFADEKAVEAAHAAADSWLEVIDDMQYEHSWSTASSLFRSAVSQSDWVQSAGAARNPFGGLVSRRLESADYHTTLPGAPDGEYVVLVFNSSFERKKEAVETLTVMMDEDSTWRVAGYFIR